MVAITYLLRFSVQCDKDFPRFSNIGGKIVKWIIKYDLVVSALDYQSRRLVFQTAVYV